MKTELHLRSLNNPGLEYQRDREVRLKNTSILLRCMSYKLKI